jgi:hypothetical protein
MGGRDDQFDLTLADDDVLSIHVSGDVTCIVFLPYTL